MTTVNLRLNCHEAGCSNRWMVTLELADDDVLTERLAGEMCPECGRENWKSDSLQPLTR